MVASVNSNQGGSATALRRRMREPHDLQKNSG